jgi:glutamyl-tRNA reductase
MVLATCHRVELYAVTDDLEGAEAALLQPGNARSHPRQSDLPRYTYSNEDAVTHLCRVACGLDSVIVGEAEISGQVRRAAALARQSGTMGPYLERIVAAALRSSGRARAETAIGRGVLSAASAAVALVSRSVDLASSTILVVGAGQTGRQVLTRLSRLNTGRRLVASRSDKHARDAAGDSGATVVPFESLATSVADVDVLFTTVQAPSFLVYAADVRDRARRPLLAVDLSVPRAIDPEAGNVDGVTLRTVDDLGDIAQASLDRRAQEIPHVEKIAADEARRALVQVRSRAARARRR